MNTISFHTILSATLIQKIKTFSDTFNTLGLHQVLTFSQLMEPKKNLEYCMAENDKNEIVGYCIIHYRYPVAFIQDGPVSNDDVVFSEMIHSIQKHYSNKYFAFTTIQLPFGCENVKNTTNQTISKHFDLPTWSTSIVELSDSMLNHFSKGHYSALKKAEKSGLTISNEITGQTIKDFATLFDETYKSRKLKPQWNNSFDYFNSVAQKITSDNGFFIGAYIDGKLVAGGFFLAFGNTVHYKFGTSNHSFRSIPLMHSVIYNAMILAKSRGYNYLDLGGINPDAQIGSQVDAINTFKKGFGGKIITSPSRIYVSNNPLTLAIVLLLLKLKKLIRK